MIKTITVTNDLFESVVFDLRNPEQSGFFIKSVEGLGPSKATVNTTEALGQDGSTLNSVRLTSRNILFDLGFLENPTIEDTRQKSYKYFPLKREIEIVIETDNRTVKTRGLVESNEPDIFSREESSKVSVLCPDPYLYSMSETVINFSSVSSLFTFPFLNNSLVDKLITLGEVQAYPQQNVYYTGDATVGIKMYIHLLGSAGSFIVYNLRTREFMKIDSDVLVALTGSGLIAGDDVVISTVKGNKYIYLLRDGETINILNTLGEDASWLNLEKGDNIFYYTADYGEPNLQFKIVHQIVYEGI